MSRAVLRLVAAGAAILLAAWGAGPSDVQRAEAQAKVDTRPNIIFVMTDDQDKDSIRQMPFVRNTLIPNGTTYPNATFNFPLCCPSRTSMLRGQYTHNHGIWENTADLGGGYENFQAQGYDQSNFPVWLNQAGYNTAGFGLYVNQYNPAVHDSPPGFDFFRFYTRDWDNKQIPMTEHRDRHVRDNAVRWLKENLSGGPLMMWVSFHAPHTPFEYDPIYEDRFADVSMPKGPAFNEADVSDKPEYVRKLPPLTEAQVARQEEIYRDRLRANLTPDDALRRLRDTVRAAGELPNTYIIFWSDNGWMMGEHRLQSGKRVPYLESGSFPMVIRGPGVPKGVTDDRVVMNQDLAPTFAELGNARIPDFVDGRSMVPILDGEGSWRNVGLIEAPPPVFSYQPPAYRGLRGQDYTYVEYANGEREYYDLVADPHQLENGYGGLPDRRKAELSALVASLSECARDVCREAEMAGPPMVERVVPVEQSVGVDPAAELEVYFSEAVKPPTVESAGVNLYRGASKTQVDVTVTYDPETEKATVVPGEPLARGVRYRAVVTTRVRDTAGNRLDQDPTRAGSQPKVWSFTVKR